MTMLKQPHLLAAPTPTLFWPLWAETPKDKDLEVLVGEGLASRNRRRGVGMHVRKRGIGQRGRLISSR